MAADWAKRLEDALVALGGGAYLKANSEAVRRALAGEPVDGGAATGRAGGRVVVNISSAHIPSFTAGWPNGGYKNAYDLEEEGLRVGEKAPVSEKRRAVDRALQPLHGRQAKDIYFAAVELNGCGVGFYGDCCLVLRDEVSEPGVHILDRNSYDLIREPLAGEIEKAAVSVEQARRDKAEALAGTMDGDLAAIAAIKVLAARQPVDRLLTTGMVSAGVLEDEDYIEVLRTDSFNWGHVAEVRLTPADVAADERVRSRSLAGQTPSHAELQWRQRRRDAEERLVALGVPVRVVTTGGRTR
jgi:hypothetical protein